MKNIIRNLLKDLKKEKIRYNHNVSGKLSKIKFPDPKNELGYFKANKYPKELIEVELIIDGESLRRTMKVIRKNNFIFYPYIRPLCYFYYDEKFGLIRLIVKTEDNQEITKEKPKKGHIICFVSPEGGGKTTALSRAYTVLEKFPVNRTHMTFSSFKESKTYRIYDLSRKIFRIKKNNLSGKITLLDRYIYLTFRKKPFLRSVFRIFAPEPSIVFILKADYQTLKKRRGPLCSSKENVNQTYKLFDSAKNKIYINSESDIDENIRIIINNILRLYEDDEEKYIRDII